jgi:hypothetical protein
MVQNEGIYRYYSSEQDAQKALRAFANSERPLLLPDITEVNRATVALNGAAMSGDISPGAVMNAYLSLQANLSVANIICCMPDPSDPTKICGSDMDIAVDWKGAFYQCRTHPSTHRIPV